MSFFSRVVCFAFFACLILNNASAKPANNVYRNFWMPSYQGARLSYCSLDGKTCGLALANQFCRMMGYRAADQQVIDYNVGLTHFIGSQSTCNGLECHGFKTIRCVATINTKAAEIYHYRYLKFENPEFEHCRLDWCYNGRKGCGQKAAFSFCRRMGYLQVKNFAIDEAVVETKAIGNQRICLDKPCKGFRFITCFR